jgi:Ca2+-transporting ATPase
MAGLSAGEAASRLLRDGPNRLPGNVPKSFPAILVGVIAEPMFLMLLSAGGVYLLLGDRTEAAFLMASVLVIISITLLQERKTRRSLEALQDLSAPRALVIRDGEPRRISSQEVVCGDLLLLQ